MVKIVPRKSIAFAVFVFIAKLQKEKKRVDVKQM